MRLQSDDDPEVTAWARSEAASSVRDVLYAKAASEIKPSKGVLRRVLFYNAYAAGFTLLLVRTRTPSRAPRMKACTKSGA